MRDDMGWCRECGHVKLNILIEEGIEWGLCEKCGETIIEFNQTIAEKSEHSRL